MPHLTRRPECLFARPALRRSPGIARVIAPAPDAMMLLGDVGELQEVSEGAGERQRRVNRQLAEQARQGVEIVVVAGRALRERSHLFDALVEIRAAVPLKDPAEQLAEHADVIAQRQVRRRACIVGRQNVTAHGCRADSTS